MVTSNKPTSRTSSSSCEFDWPESFAGRGLDVTVTTQALLLTHGSICIAVRSKGLLGVVTNLLQHNRQQLQTNGQTTT